MLTSQRKQLILEKLEAEGQVSLLRSASFSRCLRTLSAGIYVNWRQKGVCSVFTAAHCQHRQRLRLLPSVSPLKWMQKRVARRGAQLISPGQVVIIDGGTTTSELITFLPPDLRITVVTHSPGIALGLVDHPCIEVILIGGRLYKHSIVTVGAAAIEGINNIHADLFFMGVTGVHPEAGLTTGDYEEACIKRAFSGRAAETVVLASPEKINTASAFVIGDLSLVNTLVVENTTDERWVSALKEKGVAVIASQ